MVGQRSALAVVGFAFGMAAEGRFYNSLSNFLLLILYAMIPWTAINLTDFYLIRHGQYDVEAMYDKRGKYGLVRWRTLAGPQLSS